MSHSIKNVINASVIGTHCIYVKLFTDIPAILITYIISNFTQITANTITYCGAIFAIASIFFIINDNLFIAALFFYLSFICDFIDGKLARLRKSNSNYGKKLDLAFDRIIFGLTSISYLYYLEINGMYYEKILLILYIISFLLFDVLDLTMALVKYRNILESIKNKEIVKDDFNESETEKYFYSIKSIKRWVPSRIGSVGFVFILAPIINFKFFYLISLIAILIRFIWLLFNYFKQK